MHDIKKRVAEVLPKQLAEKWEGRIRRNTLEKEGFTPLNEMVSFGLEPEFPGEVGIHIHENLTKTPIEANRLMLSGLKLLAERLKADETLAHTEKISGYSWIVYNSPDILQRLGFTVSKQDHKKKIALATMDKEDFLHRFGSRVDK